MPKVYKHEIKVTVLSNDETLEKALGEGWDLEDVDAAITNGDCIGSVKHEGSTEIPEDKLEQELLDIGNDGSFFDSLDDDE